MHISSYLAHQKQDFIRAFNSNYPVGIQSPADLSRFISPAATWRWDNTFKEQKAIVRTVQGQHQEYWIDVYENEYRSGFKRFLESEYQVPQESVRPDLNADHMLNREFAKRHGLQFVRMAVVPATFNSGWGGKIEKLLTQMVARDNSCYRFDYFIFMKVLNIVPPKDKADYTERRTAIAERLSLETGLDNRMVLEGMDGIFGLWDVL